jgi:cell division protein FtsI/penicillin-binding protein 2
MYDRFGLDDQTYNILGIDVPSITVPVRPGRSLPIILEIAAMNHRQKKMGYNTAAELEKADRLCEKYPGLHIKLRWERRIAANQQEMIGEVRQINGVEVGISGLEKKYDSLLRGTPGQFTVMLDRHGHWINSTFRIVKAAENGEDLLLTAAEESDNESTP